VEGSTLPLKNSVKSWPNSNIGMFATSDTFFDSFVRNNSFSISEKTLTPELVVAGDGIEFEIEDPKQVHGEFRDSNNVAKKKIAELQNISKYFK
jgi:hypothetical protein